MRLANRLRYFVALSSVFFSLGVTAETIDEIVVTADFRGRTANEIPVSITALDGDQIEQLASQHFEELINAIPNLNWSGDGHRARYFQMRGVGELEQYQGAPNPSVGFLIDDIDFSGIGTVATLFDIERVEVLRGPQGSRYGANALAGLVYMQSTLPTAERNGRLKVSVGDDDAYSAGVAFSGALDADENTLFRLSAHHHQSDGFRGNSFLGRDDTNGRDETVVRGRVAMSPQESVDINLAILYASVDNGYDAFAIDNSYSVLSDKPGKDAQESIGTSFKVDWHDLSGMALTSITTYANSDIDFDFDADWGNDTAWAPFVYDFISLTDRSRQTIGQEFRLASTGVADTNWLLGLYGLNLEEDLVTFNQGEYFDPFFNFSDSLLGSFDNDYSATNTAIFGQIDHLVGESSRLSFGLRIERRTSDYSDSAGLTIDTSDSMLGGELSMNHEHSDDVTSYVTLSKGYKAGGFNLGAVPPGRREFGQEELWSLEAGIKSVWLNDSVSVNAAVFYVRRNDQQVRTSVQLVPNDPASFVFFTDNAAEGKTLGVEADIRWLIGDAWELYANIGLLDATFENYQTPTSDLSGREQAHAPRYTFAAGGRYQHSSGWFARLDVSARDDFYFDVSHDQQSQPYELVNARLGYSSDEWSAQLWIRNLLDEQYAVRGFYFGNEPPNFPNTLYTRLGDPRQFGITFDKRF